MVFLILAVTALIRTTAVFGAWLVWRDPYPVEKGWDCEW